MKTLFKISFEAYEDEVNQFWLQWNDVLPLTEVTPQYKYIWLCEKMDFFLKNYFVALGASSFDLTKLEAFKLKRFRNGLSVIIDDQYYIIKNDAFDSNKSSVKLLFIDLLSGFDSLQPRTNFLLEDVSKKCGKDFFKTLDFLEIEFSSWMSNGYRWPVIKPPCIDYTKSFWLEKHEFLIELNTLVINHFTNKKW